MAHEIDEQLATLISGFGVLLPADLAAQAAQCFTPVELLQLLGGLAEIDDAAVEDWQKHANYEGGLRATSAISEWFWEAVR